MNIAAVLLEEIRLEEKAREERKVAARRRRNKRNADLQKKDWVDQEVLHEIYAYETDVVMHERAGFGGSVDEIVAAVRAELGRNLDPRSLRVEEDPEEWYEHGDDTWEPEWPEFMSDRGIHQRALIRERDRKIQEQRADPSHPYMKMKERGLPKTGWQSREYLERQLQWILKGERE